MNQQANQETVTAEDVEKARAAFDAARTERDEAETAKAQSEEAVTAADQHKADLEQKIVEGGKVSDAQLSAAVHGTDAARLRLSGATGRLEAAKENLKQATTAHVTAMVLADTELLSPHAEQQFRAEIADEIAQTIDKVKKFYASRDAQVTAASQAIRDAGLPRADQDRRPGWRLLWHLAASEDRTKPPVQWSGEWRWGETRWGEGLVTEESGHLYPAETSEAADARATLFVTDILGVDLMPLIQAAWDDENLSTHDVRKLVRNKNLIL